MPVYPYEGVSPQIESDVLLCPGAMVVGRVKIGAGSSVWYNAVIRGDVHDVIIGQYTSIQDGTLIHEDSGRGSGLEGGLPTVVGDYVTVGHGVILHACRVEDYALIGMGAIIMDGAVIGKGAVVGAGALVTKNTVVRLVLVCFVQNTKNSSTSITATSRYLSAYYHCVFFEV